MFVFALADWRPGNVWVNHLRGTEWSTTGNFVIGKRTFLSPPSAVLVDEKHIEVFAVGLDNRVYRACYVLSAWTTFDDGDQWEALPDIFALSQVSTVVTDPNKDSPCVVVTVIDHAFRLQAITLTFQGGYTAAYNTSAAIWQQLSDTPAP